MTPEDIRSRVSGKEPERLSADRQADRQQATILHTRLMKMVPG